MYIHRSSRVILFGLIVLVLVLTSRPNLTVQAAPGDLDPTFGIGGKVVTDFGALDFGSAIAIQTDGKIVIAGGSTYRGDGPNRFALARYNPNGTPDSSFGSGGKVTTLFDGGEEAQALAIQPNGQIVVVGRQFSNDFGYYNWIIVRYNSDGSVDTTFGEGGRTITDFGTFDEAYAVAVQADGKILVAGSGDQKFAVARYQGNGDLDLSFGSGGKVVTLLPYWGYAESLVLQPDGKIVVAGNDLFSFAMVRLDSYGNYDPTFGAGGKVITNFSYCSGYGPSQDAGRAVALQKDGKIVVAGLTSGYSTDNCVHVVGLALAIARYNPDGSLDSAFGSGGKVVTEETGEGQSVEIQPDGKILVAGTTFTPGTGNVFSLNRYNANGTLDSSFGAGGKITTSFGTTYDIAFSMALQSDGRIILGGRAGGDFALARYNAGGFDLCIQDESNGNILQLNTTTGEYQFTNCAGLTVGGTGLLTRRGSLINLQHNATDRRIMASIDTSTNKASATIQLFSQGRTFSITDRNITNNTCACR